MTIEGRSDDGLAFSLRERGKDGRRRRIVEAAHDLLREFALDDVSGRMIAERAEVSLSTIYNLFSSKEAVLVAVYDDDLRAFEHIVRNLPSADPLSRLFDTIDAAAAQYDRDPTFYRAIMVRRASTKALEAALRRPRADFWLMLVEQAMRAGEWQRGADAALVSRLLVLLFSGALADWVAGDISLDRFRLELGLGFASILMSSATGTTRARLDEYAVQFRNALAPQWTDAPRPAHGATAVAVPTAEG